MFLLLSVFYYFYFSIIGIYVIFLPKVLSDLGYSGSEIGIIFAAAPLVRFVLPFLFMRGLELNSRLFYIALWITLVSAGSFFLAIGNFYALLVSNIFFGVGLSLILPYVELIALESIGKERYGKVRLYGSLGFIVVALVLVKFLHTYMVALSALLALSIIMAVVAFFIARRVAHTQTQQKESGSEHFSLLADWKLWVSFFLMQASFGSFYNFFTIYETDLGISLDMTIYLWSFGVIVEVLMLFVQGRFLQNNLLSILRFTILATAFRWYLLYLYGDRLSIVFLAQSLHALSFALFHSAAISYLYMHFNNKALAQQFFSGISYGLGGLLGAVVAGYIYEYFAAYLFAISAWIALGSFVMMVWYQQERSHSGEHKHTSSP